MWISAIGNKLRAYYFDGTLWNPVNSYDITSDATKYTTAGYLSLAIFNTNTRVDDFGGGSVTLRNTRNPAINYQDPAYV